MFTANRSDVAAVALSALAGTALILSSPARAEPRHEYAEREAVHPLIRRETPAHPGPYAPHAGAGHATVLAPHASARPVPHVGPAATHPISPATQAVVHAPGYGAPSVRPPAAMPVMRSRVFAGRGFAPRIYQAHVWHQFGHAFTYQSYVPAVQFPAAYYGWALARWPHPVAYAWSWQAQPWYPRYGVLFTPYPVYSSPDLWMTDYILAQNMQAAYQAQPGVQAVTPPPAGDFPPAASAMDPGASTPDPAPADPTSVQQPGDPSPVVSAAVPPPAPPAPPPPAVTPAIKAQLNTQIKVQLQDRQMAAATPASLTTDNAPPALRADHVFFEVVQPLSVPVAATQGMCTLRPNDYIRRTGGMSQDDWMIPVVVELSGASDCPVGLHTRIGLNDLNAMENEQEARVFEALQAAKSVGPSAQPKDPAAHPSLIADGAAAPDPAALLAIR